MNLIRDITQRRAIVDPLLLALKSRRVIVALCALLVGVLVLAVPELDAVRGELLVLLITLALAVIGGYSVEDAAHAAREHTSTVSDADLRDLLYEVLDELIEELSNRE